MWFKLHALWYRPPEIDEELKTIRSEREKAQQALKDTRATLNGEADWFKERYDKEREKWKT